MNYFKLPFITPFKFVPSTSTPGKHFDDDWYFNKLKHYQRHIPYRQKWEKADTTKIQCESTVEPEVIKVYNTKGIVVRTFNWIGQASGVNYVVYEATIDFSGLPDGIYYLYNRVALLSVDWRMLTEPIHIRDKWPGTRLIKYKHKFNDYDVAWSTGIEMKFRCEAEIYDFMPKHIRTDNSDSSGSVVTLFGLPTRMFKLHIGSTGFDTGVPEYVLDILNRIMLCSSIQVDDFYYQCAPGAEWEKSAVKGYPLITAQIDIVPAKNAQSLEFAETTPLAPGLVTAYNLHTAFFGGGTLVPITDVEKQS
jgi:hypothetical protein